MKLFEKIRNFESKFNKVELKRLTKKSEKYQIWHIKATRKKTNSFLIVIDKKLEVIEVKLIPVKKVDIEAKNMLNFYTLKRKLFQNRKAYKQLLLLYSAFSFLDTYLRDSGIVEKDKKEMWVLKDEYSENDDYKTLKNITIELNYLFFMNKKF